MVSRSRLDVVRRYTSRFVWLFLLFEWVGDLVSFHAIDCEVGTRKYLSQSCDKEGQSNLLFPFAGIPGVSIFKSRCSTRAK